MRVISLLPAATEIVAYLGASDQLVGITHECDFPPVLSSRPRVTRSVIPMHAAYDTVSGTADAGADADADADGDASTPGEIDAAVREASNAGLALFKLDKKLIASLHPDVILTQALCDVCAVSETDVRALAARLSPSPAIVTLKGTTIDGIFADIAVVAEALGVSDEAEELLAGEHARLRTVHETLKAEGAPRPRVLVVEWTDPVFIAGHWGPEQVRKAGGRDVMGSAGAHSVTVPMADCAAAEPEIVLIAPCGYGLEAARREAERLLRDPAWSWLAGRQVWAMDANGLVSRPGPRVVDGVEAMSRIFNPTLFSPLDPLHGVRVA
jgi:iron complex transport system substrate-binding protein